MGGISIIFVLLGGIFGSFEVTTVAFTREAGVPETAGLLLALYAVGSLSAGLIFGALAIKASLAKQFMIAVSALAVVTAPLPFLSTVWLLAIGLFVAGVACSPVLISGMALIERVVPSGRLTESMTWASSGLAVGIATATPLAGVVIDRYGAQTAYWVTSGCAVVAFLIGLIVFRSLRNALAGAEERADRVLCGNDVADRRRPPSRRQRRSPGDHAGTVIGMDIGSGAGVRDELRSRRRKPSPDDALFGPGSMTWRVHADPVFAIGGMRALIMQALHPLAMAAVDQHHSFEEDFWGRLERTTQYVSTLTFSPAKDAERAAARVRGIHRKLRGTDPVTGAEFRLDRPDLLLWVHCCEVDSLLTTARRAGAPDQPGRCRRVPARAGADGRAGRHSDRHGSGQQWPSCQQYFRDVRPALAVDR